VKREKKKKRSVTFIIEINLGKKRSPYLAAAEKKKGRRRLPLYSEGKERKRACASQSEGKKEERPTLKKSCRKGLIFGKEEGNSPFANTREKKGRSRPKEYSHLHRAKKGRLSLFHLRKKEREKRARGKVPTSTFSRIGRRKGKERERSHFSS